MHGRAQRQTKWTPCSLIISIWILNLPFWSSACLRTWLLHSFLTLKTQWVVFNDAISQLICSHTSEEELCQKPSSCDSLGGCFLLLGWAKARQGYHFMGTFYPQAFHAPGKGENVAGIVLRKSGDSERRWFLRNGTQLRDWRFFFEKLAISVKTVININLLYQPNLDITFFLLTLKVQE